MIKVLERDLSRGRAGSLVCKYGFLVRKDVVEQSKLDILSCERFCVMTFNWKCFAAKISHADNQGTFDIAGEEKLTVEWRLEARMWRMRPNGRVWMTSLLRQEKKRKRKRKGKTSLA